VRQMMSVRPDQRERRQVIRLRASARNAGWLIAGLTLVFCTACASGTHPESGDHLPNAREARRAVEECLETWRKSPRPERTVPRIQPVMFVDQQRQPGQRLREFAVLGETPGVKGCRRFVVKLSLEQPDESILASYYVFGEGPVWVYRAEDFDMILHMDKSMMPDPQPAVDRPGSKTSSTAEADPSPREAKSKESRQEASSTASP
jgi:hypothetical protein